MIAEIGLHHILLTAIFARLIRRRYHRTKPMLKLMLQLAFLGSIIFLWFFLMLIALIAAPIPTPGI